MYNNSGKTYTMTRSCVFHVPIRSALQGRFVFNLAILPHLRHVENGRAWVSDPAAARSENVALPSFIRVVRVVRCKKSYLIVYSRGTEP